MITLKIAGTKYFPVQLPLYGESLQLQADPENEHDPNAVKVLDKDGDQIGYVPAPAAAIMSLLAQGLNIRPDALFKAEMSTGENLTLSLRQEAVDYLIN
jgi:HIRAN domain-containing protein